MATAIRATKKKVDGSEKSRRILLRTLRPHAVQLGESVLTRHFVRVSYVELPSAYCLMLRARDRATSRASKVVQSWRGANARDMERKGLIEQVYRQSIDTAGVQARGASASAERIVAGRRRRKERVRLR